MLDYTSIKLLSATLAAILITRFLLSTRYARPTDGEDMGQVKATTPAPILNALCPILSILPVVFCVLGALTPDLIYGTPLNIAFSGSESLQYASAPLIVFGAALAALSSKALGQQASVAAEVREKPHLITSGPYSYVRHPGYTARIMIDLGIFLLFFNVLQLLGCVTWILVARRKASIEEELLSSEKGFGKEYLDYMSKTGRFLPKLR